MFSMQYRIPFGEDFDMEQIRTRIRERSSPYEGLPGLSFKAFMMQSVGSEGVNTYSSFYVWQTPEAFRRYLDHPEMFGSLVRGFGRPPVVLETVLEYAPVTGQPASAIYTASQIPDGISYGVTIDKLRNAHAPLAPVGSVISISGNPWRVSCFSFLDAAPTKQQRETLGDENLWFQVVHVSGS